MTRYNTIPTAHSATLGSGLNPARIWAVLAMAWLLLSASLSFGGGPANVDRAVASARASNKLVVLIFEQEGCPVCSQYSRQLSQPAARRALQRAVVVRVETSDNPRLAAMYRAENTPTTFILGPSNDYSAPLFAGVGSLSSREVESRIAQFSPGRKVAAAR